MMGYLLPGWERSQPGSLWIRTLEKNGAAPIHRLASAIPLVQIDP
jgi:hypothetical protein